MEDLHDITGLVAEYRSVLAGCHPGEKRLVAAKLVSEGDWTPAASEHLVRLVDHYGSFMLRNALAIALALKAEDGKLGF